MQDALLSARDETEQGATLSGQHALRALFEKLGTRLNANSQLRPVSAAVSVRARYWGLVIADGPFAETKERMPVVVACEDVDDVAAGGSPSRASTKEVYR